MATLEMIDKLRERADLSYEEARTVLEEAGGDLLEAFVILEKQGRMKQPQAENTAEEQKAEVMPKEMKENGLVKAFRGSEIFAMPSLVFAGLLFVCWEPIIPVMIIALFFDVRYRFDGSKDAQPANDILNKAGSFVDGFESGIAKEV